MLHCKQYVYLLLLRFLKRICHGSPTIACYRIDTIVNKSLCPKTFEKNPKGTGSHFFHHSNKYSDFNLFFACRSSGQLQSINLKRVQVPYCKQDVHLLLLRAFLSITPPFGCLMDFVALSDTRVHKFRFVLFGKRGHFFPFFLTKLGAAYFFRFQ